MSRPAPLTVDPPRRGRDSVYYLERARDIRESLATGEPPERVAACHGVSRAHVLAYMAGPVLVVASEWRDRP